jgi:hypothetical protein
LDVDTSIKILVTAGTLVLLYAFALGLPMARARMRAPAAPRHLVNTHLEALQAGAVLLALSLAASFGTLGSGVENTAAWLLTAGVAATLVGGTLNWLLAAGDTFAERPPGFYFQSVGGPLILAGGAILAIGVLKAL